MSYVSICLGDTTFTSQVNDEDKTAVGKSGQVVLDLTGELPPDSDVASDNYFNSTALFQVLSERNIRAVGTVRLQR